MFEVEYESPGERTGELHPASPFSLLVDGVNIDDEFTNDDIRVETISIHGRQTNEYDIQTATPAKYDGQMVLGKRLKAKPIQVVLLIESNEYGLTQAFMSDLNHMLKNAKAIGFKDEPEWTYFVEFEGADNPDENLRQEVTLNYLWHDPVKYTSERTQQYTNAQHLNIASDEPVDPYIEIVFDTGVKVWSMRNTTTNTNINYEHEIVSNRYQVDAEAQLITKGVNRADAMDGVKLDFGLEEFTVKTGDQLVVTPTPASITIKYRGVSL